MRSTPALWCVTLLVVPALAVITVEPQSSTWSPLDAVWSPSDKQQSESIYQCPLTTFPSGNKQLVLSGSRLNTLFSYWRSNQSSKTPLPAAIVITFFSPSCPFSRALLELMDEVARHFAKQSIKFIKVDTAQLAYSDMIKMGVTAVPVVRLHTQDKRLTYHGKRQLAALTQHITEYTGITAVPSSSLNMTYEQGVYAKSPNKVATAKLEDMQALSTAPLTLISAAITVLFLAEQILHKRCWQAYIARWQRVPRVD